MFVSAPNCVKLLRKSKYFSINDPLSNRSQKIFYATNRNIENASHTLLAHHLLSDIIQSVFSNTEAGNSVQQVGSHFALKGLRLPSKTKLAKLIYQFNSNIQLTEVFIKAAHTERFFFRKAPLKVYSKLKVVL